jgi:hypothetical protein
MNVQLYEGVEECVVTPGAISNDSQRPGSVTTHKISMGLRVLLQIRV